MLRASRIVRLAVIVVVGITAVASRPAGNARADEPEKADPKEQIKAQIEALASYSQILDREAADLKKTLREEVAKVGHDALPDDDLLAFGGAQRLREEFVQTTIQLIAAQALLKHRENAWVDGRDARAATLQSRVLQALRTEPEFQERAMSIQKAEARLREAEQLTTSPQDPAVVRAKKFLMDLRTKAEARSDSRRAEIVVELNALENQTDEANRLREAQEKVVTLRAVEARLSAILSAARRQNEPGKAAVAANLESLREKYGSLSRLREELNRRLEGLRFSLGSSVPPPAPANEGPGVNGR